MSDRHPGRRGATPFVPPLGSFAARMLIFQRNHPRNASRHVVLAVGKVAAALLGLAVFVRLLLEPVLQLVTIGSPTSICHPSRRQISRGRTHHCPTSICLSWAASWLRVIIGTASSGCRC